jgi:ABC-type spermidine/putrescine transport system permease subunit II
MFLRLFAAVLSLFFAFPSVFAFTYSFGTPSECDNIPLTWTGESFCFDFCLASLMEAVQEERHHFNY